MLLTRRLFIREIIGVHVCLSAARPIIDRNAFLRAGSFFYKPAQYNVLNLSNDSLSVSVVRTPRKRNIVSSRAALTLVGYIRGDSEPLQTVDVNLPGLATSG